MLRIPWWVWALTAVGAFLAYKHWSGANAEAPSGVVLGVLPVNINSRTTSSLATG